MWQRFSPPTRAIILSAQNRALASKSENISPTHFVLALLETATPDSSLGALILSANLKVEEARLYVEATIEPPSGSTLPYTANNISLSASAKRVLELAAHESRQEANPQIEPEHLLFACLRPQREDTVRSTLAQLGWDVAELRAKRRQLQKLASAQHNKNPLRFLTSNSQTVIDAAYTAMRATWSGRISTAHLLMGVLEDTYAIELLTKTGVSTEELKKQTRAAIRSDSQIATSDKRFGKGAKRALDRAKQEAFARGYKFISPEHILLGLLPRRATLRETLTWGNSVPDEAALVLSQLDAAKLRALMAPKLKNKPPQPKTPSPDVPRNTSAFSFIFMCGIATLLMATLNHSHYPMSAAERLELFLNPIGVTERLGTLFFMALMLGSALGACWMLVRSRKSHLKSAWVSAFFGFIVGTMLAVLLFSR